jgi:dienelactone hydrolase
MRFPSLVFALFAPPLLAAEPSPVAELLKRPLLPANDVTLEVREYVRPKIVRLHPPASDKTAVRTAADWEREAERIRQDVLKNVVFRGEAAKWRDAKVKVEWLETLPGDGYRIKKVRYEILPDFWIPALLYEPEKLEGKAPVSLAVNGHDGNGKVADYKQIRCINMVKRGMIVLNVEWLGMGQLRGAGYRHAVMNQLDLCGSSGLAPFYLSMSRGLDLLLAHPNADPKRVAVSGLSGGGWQTITISSLDPRVTLSNPVAGYSSFLTRIDHFKDLGDSEQTPTDLAVYADYTHLTAMMAPRPTLLTYNLKDNCCFEATYALEPLRAAAAPYFKLFDREKALRTHVSAWPGDHNFGIDNRQALYCMIGDFFYPDNAGYNSIEMACIQEVRRRDELDVPLPAGTLDMNALATALAKKLPRDADWPSDGKNAADWQTRKRKELADVLRIKPGLTVHERSSPDNSETRRVRKDGVMATYRLFKAGDAWTIPAVALVKDEPKGTTLVIADKGRMSVADEVDRLLAQGQRVIVLDLFYFGEAHPKSHDYLWALMLATVGERALGLQANQLLGVARWVGIDAKSPVTIVADGPRSSVIALTAAALDEKAIGRVETISPMGSLKQIIESNRGLNESPELFCFGLLERFDVKHLAALVAPRPVVVRNPDERARAEFAQLADWYRGLGVPHNPLK